MSEKEKMMEAQEEGELKRGIKGWQVAFIGLGGVIGSCYFMGVGSCISIMGPAVFIGFGIVGVIVYGLMIAYAELLVNLPRKGSFVAYTNEFLGPTLSCGMGWSFWFNWVCYCPSEAIAVANVLQALTGSTSAFSYIAFAVGALLALTIINLCAVDIFAKIESGLAITKVCVIIVFILMAFGIWVGLWGTPDSAILGSVEDGFKGMGVNFGSGDFTGDLFPNGIGMCLIMMVVVLVTFQGTEIVGLTAAESEDPDTAVPKACKSVTYRIVGLYLVPILLCILVYPTALGTDATPIFSDIMKAYGFNGLGTAFLAIVLVAAFSCANTGFYGTVRAMYGLSIEGLAPKFLSKVNKSGNPKNAVLFTLAFMWVVLILGLISEVGGLFTNLYGMLLSLSGFTGTLAWVGIIASQKKFRKRYVANGHDVSKLQASVSKGQAWIPWFAMIAQLICLLMLAFGDVIDPEGNAGGGTLVFIVACCAVGFPMIGYQIAKKTGKLRDMNTLGKGEKTFDEMYPPINK